MKTPLEDDHYYYYSNATIPKWKDVITQMYKEFIMHNKFRMESFIKLRWGNL